jgi:hypothetical protein
MPSRVAVQSVMARLLSVGRSPEKDWRKRPVA